MTVSPPPIFNPSPLIEVSQLRKVYDQFTAVSQLSFQVRAGEVLGLVGPNGAGKTTTLRCLAGIIPPTEGEISIAGHELKRAPILAKQKLAFFPDEPRLFDYLNVEQHMQFTARLYQVSDSAAVTARLLDELELSDKKKLLPSELSRGMKQKLVIACGFLHAPQVIIFDEPLTGLDPAGIKLMKQSILQRARAGAAIIISSHLLSLLEEVCTHVLILKNGHAVFNGALQEMEQRYGGPGQPLNLEEVFFRVTGQEVEQNPSLP